MSFAIYCIFEPNDLDQKQPSEAGKTANAFAYHPISRFNLSDPDSIFEDH